MKNVIKQLAVRCRDWADSPDECEVLTKHNPNILFRYTYEDKDIWHTFQIDTFNQFITEDIINDFYDNLPKDKDINTRVIVTSKGHSLEAGILASRLKIWLLIIIPDTTDSRIFSLFYPVVNSCNINTDTPLSSTDWSNIHSLLEDSSVNYLRETPSVKAEIFNKTGDKVCDFVNLESGLPFEGSVAGSQKDYTHNFALPGCTLEVAEFRIPLSEIKLQYFWDSRVLSGDDLVETLGELFFGCAFG